MRAALPVRHTNHYGESSVVSLYRHPTLRSLAPVVSVRFFLPFCQHSFPSLHLLTHALSITYLSTCKHKSHHRALLLTYRYCFVPSRTVPYSTVQYRTVSYRAALISCKTIPYSTVLYCTATHSSRAKLVVPVSVLLLVFVSQHQPSVVTFTVPSPSTGAHCTIPCSITARVCCIPLYNITPPLKRRVVCIADCFSVCCLLLYAPPPPYLRSQPEDA